MKIKTVIRYYAGPGAEDFDLTVNDALADGWRLVERKTLPGQVLGNKSYAPSLYAELVKLDPPPVEEPKTIDPLEALVVIRSQCQALTPADCEAGRCPLHGWCNRPRNQIKVAPLDWVLPTEKGGE